MSMPTILVAEDQQNLRRVYTRHLEKEGYRVLQAEDGQAAIEVLESNQVDLVLSDLMMPRLDGIALCGKVKANPAWAKIPFIILTAQTSSEKQVEGLDCGADDYILKPIQPAILLARVRSALRRTGIATPVAETMEFGGLSLHNCIGSGTYGEVYLARDSELNRNVAVKIIRREFIGDTQARERFLREAKAMCAVRHPGVVSVHAVGEHDGRPYIVMEHLTGGDLADRLAEKRLLPEGEVVPILLQVLDALAALHEAEIVHRDIKPENILFDVEGRAVLVDFGIALDAHVARMTSTGMVVGTLVYMAPEQFEGSMPDGRMDLYSLGVVAYESLAGVPPFRAGSPQGIMGSILSEAPKGLKERGVDVNPRLEEIILRLLAKDASERYQTANDVIAALTDL